MMGGGCRAPQPSKADPLPQARPLHRAASESVVWPEGGRYTLEKNNSLWAYTSPRVRLKTVPYSAGSHKSLSDFLKTPQLASRLPHLRLTDSAPLIPPRTLQALA